MKTEVLSFRPTQFVVGMREVDSKIHKIGRISPADLKEWIQEHPVPSVIGPNGAFYMIDHHHFVAACYHSRIDRVVADVIDDKSNMGLSEFWAFMKAKNWAYLKDQFGNGPHESRFLPTDVRGMGDDVYRSLAWELREAGLIEKVQKPYSEFKWAELMRGELKVNLHAETYEQAVKRAIDFAKKMIAQKKVPK